MVTWDGIIKIAGFGLCAQIRRGDGSKLKRISMEGTIYWMAPEVIQNATGLAQYDEKVIFCFLLPKGRYLVPGNHCDWFINVLF